METQTKVTNIDLEREKAVRKRLRTLCKEPNCARDRANGSSRCSYHSRIGTMTPIKPVLIETK